MAFKTSEKYKSVIYSGDCRHKLKLLFNDVELEDADVYCESLKVTSRILPNGSTRFSLDNFIAKEAELILHDIDTTKIQSPVNISIGTLVDGTYEYVPIGLFVVQDLPTTDKNKTTIKLRDYAVKFDFGYNAKDIIDENGGSVTKLQILQDICNKAGVETDITKFYGSNSKIGIYDNTITGRTYISYLAEQAGAIATIDRSGKLIFVQLKDLETVEIPLNIVEKYEDGEKYEISRVVYEDAIRKFEYGDESKDTLFINTANPYIENNVLTDIASGSKIETSDSSDNSVVSYKQYGYTKQNVYSGKNKFNVEDITVSNLTTIVDKNISSFKYTNHWASELMSDTKLKELLEPSTDYIVSAKVTLISKPDVSELTSGNHGNIMILYKAGETTKAMLATTLDIKNNWKVGETKELSTTLTTPADLTGWKILTYTYLTANYGVGEFQIDYMMIRKKDENDTFEPYVGGKASPSPEYPQEIEVGRGKNLLSVPFTQYNANNLRAEIPNFKAGTYTFSFKGSLVATWQVTARKIVNGTQTQINAVYNAYSLTFTLDEEATLQLEVYRTGILLSDISEEQLEPGEKATSYLPYNTIENKSTGKNLFDIDDINRTLSATKDDDGWITINVDNTNGTGWYYANYMTNNSKNIKPNTEYALILEVKEVSGTGTIIPNGYQDNQKSQFRPYYAIQLNGLKVGTYKKILTSISEEETAVSMLRTLGAFNVGQSGSITFRLSLVEDTSITTDNFIYEPYKESSITYNLGDNFLADKDYIKNGVLNKNIGKVVLDGSEDSWVENSVSKGLFQITLSNVYYNNTTINASSDKLIGTTGIAITSSYYVNNSVATYSANRLFFRFDEFAENLDGLKTWLSENNVEVYYQLATSEQIPLETTGELRTFEPNTIITNDLDSEMEVEYARNQTQVSQILELNKNIPLNSFKTGKIIGNPAIDAYDIIKIVDDDKEFKTLATNDLTYNGVMINSFDTQIGKEAKKENVTLTPEATFKKWAKTEIDNVEASVKITTGKIEEAVLDLETDVNNNSVNINNNYQEILGKFEGYTPTSQTIQLEQSVTQLQTDTYTKTEINTKLTDGSVTKVRTTSGTFDEDGMHYEKTGAPTKSTINEAGVSVDSSSSGEELLFAGYDKDINQTIVRTENLTVRRYLVIGENTRIEDYTDEDGNVGGGLFIL